MIHIVVSIITGISILAFIVTKRSMERRLSGVRLGDLWEIQSGRWPGVYEVVAANIDTEAGPDSWVMGPLFGGGHRVVYMHHAARVAGDWVLVMRNGVPTPMWWREKQRRLGAARFGVKK